VSGIAGQESAGWWREEGIEVNRANGSCLLSDKAGVEGFIRQEDVIGMCFEMVSCLGDACLL
jgi:hypothetical protein